jgi:hypothetical protein
MTGRRVRVVLCIRSTAEPAKLGKLDGHDQEPWKALLPQFIET